MIILKGISSIYFIRKLIIIIIDTKEGGASSLIAASTIAESSVPDEEQQSVVNYIKWVSKDQIIDGTRVPLNCKKIKLIKIINEIKKDYIIFCILFVYLLFSAFGLFQ